MLTKEQFQAAIRMVKATHCDHTHCVRVLAENEWDEIRAKHQLETEKAEFSLGKITFGPNKEVIRS